MHVLFAMGFTTTSDDRGYILWLAQHWTIFIIPAFLLIAVVTVSIIHFARSHSGPVHPAKIPATLMPVCLGPRDLTSALIQQRPTVPGRF
jgi:hypothetical protein